MREILFRGKRTHDNEWTIGSLHIEKFIEDEEYICCEINQCDVHPETVGQYTGLTDKNGKKIFEGDIIKHFNGIGIGLPDIYEICEIRWNKKEARFESIHRDKKAFLISNKNEKIYEVIGNIHDNPELLKGGADE